METNETKIPIAEVMGLLPPGITVTANTVRRWATVGVGGRRLDSFWVGGRLWTSKEAVGRFLAAKDRD